ncbi:hypothetical protein ACFXD5_36435 [Streptomyces sp. NPDC059385]|uniref:hypothetical protein n=1 Tax=Streptomyces sp. NPDC059385 TaxID=3346817 RepID=UPI0036920BB5
MHFPVTVHRPRLGPREFTVIRPARPPERALLVEDDWFLNAYVDRHAARLIGGLWGLAATSPRALVHVPLRRAGAPGDAGTRRLDLVLLHHSLQFAPSRWKELRGRLGAGHRRTVTVSTARPEIDWEALHHAENRDLFHQHVHAETLFVTGSAKAFRETAGHFHDVAAHGPGHTADRHYCARLHHGDDSAREIHIEYGDAWAGDVASR